MCFNSALSGIDNLEATTAKVLSATIGYEFFAIA